MILLKLIILKLDCEIALKRKIYKQMVLAF